MHGLHSMKLRKSYTVSYSEFESEQYYDYHSKVGVFAPRYVRVLKQYLYEYAGKRCLIDQPVNKVTNDILFLIRMFKAATLRPRSLDLKNHIVCNKDVFQSIMPSIEMVLKNHLERRNIKSMKTVLGITSDFELMIALYSSIQRLVKREY